MLMEGDCPSTTECVICIQKAFFACWGYFIFILPVFYKFLEANRHFTLQIYSYIFGLCSVSVNHRNWAVLSSFSPRTWLLSLLAQNLMEPVIDVT
jgi:hypothetical protein